MNDMTATIAAKSDQINAADLIGISRTVTIREVRIKAGEDQPVTILIEGDKKAFRPCKGVRRLLVRVWGPDANKYIGQSLTLFCDPTVTWAGKEEGGIRVSHMTGLDEKIIEFMRVSRAATKPYEILPLRAEKPAPPVDGARTWADGYKRKVDQAQTADELNAFANERATKLAELQTKRPELHLECVHALDNKRAALAAQAGAIEDTGEDFADDFDDEGEEA
jgi:hypothetical protein